jgi:Hint domain
MSDHQELPTPKLRHARRHLLKVGSIGLAAFLARLLKPRPASATQICFLRGTMIRTAIGDRRVEDLVPGDLLPTVFGGTQPIQWVGRYPYKRSDRTKPWVKSALPVRIAASALAPNVPHSDLLVTQVHALLIDGVRIKAGTLINGRTITLYEAEELDELEYFHIKLENHDVIYAEGAPCETLWRVSEAAVNFADYYRQYGTPKRAPASCAPLLDYNGGLGMIRSHLRSAFAPWIDRRRPLDIIRDRIEERALLSD